MEFQREFIEIGSVQIRYYGIIIVVGMLLATLVAARLAQRTGRDPEHVYGALTWAIIPGIIGARLWFVFFPPATLVEQGQDTAWYLQNFFDLDNGAIAIWSGGLSIFGAMLGGLLGAYIYLRKNRLPVMEWLDIAAVVLPLGQAVGRWANWVNRELFGTPITQDWLEWIGLSIPRDVRETVGYGGIIYEDAKFHPLFLYESLWSLAAFFVLLWLYNNHRDRFRVGDFFLLYIVQYSFIRFWLEFIRVEITTIPGTDINLSQAVTLVAFVLALLALFLRHRSTSDEGYRITPMDAEDDSEEVETIQVGT
jgi:phosphatidylglycerol:prolipoprotein diacylglycerol transferase